MIEYDMFQFLDKSEEILSALHGIEVILFGLLVCLGVGIVVLSHGLIEIVQALDFGDQEGGEL